MRACVHACVCACVCVALNPSATAAVRIPAGVKLFKVCGK